MFLDIACFFTGKNRDTAIRIWEGSMSWKIAFFTSEDSDIAIRI